MPSTARESWPGRQRQPQTLPRLSLLLLESLRSLGADRLETQALHVLRRFKELGGPRWDHEELRAASTGLPGVYVKECPGDPRRFQLLFAGENADVIDQTSTVDPYPEHLWEDFRLFVAASAAQWVEILGSPTSRYELARTLRARIPALWPLVLGEVCHMVQLAVKIRRLVGYKNGMFVPYVESDDFEKQQRASWRVPQPSKHTVISSWQEAERAIACALNESPAGVPLSALKQRIAKVSGLELSETVLGCTRLLHVVKDPRLAHVCNVSARGVEYFLCPAKRARPRPTRLVKRANNDDAMPTEVPPELRGDGGFSLLAFWSSYTFRTFLHIGQRGGGGALRRCKSAPEILAHPVHGRETDLSTETTTMGSSESSMLEEASVGDDADTNAASAW